MGVFSKPTAKGGKSLRWYVSFRGLDGRRRKIVGRGAHGDTKPAAERKLREYERLVDAYPKTLHEELKHLSVPEAIRVLQELGASVEQRNAVLGRIRLLAPKATDKTMADLRKEWLDHARDKRSLRDDKQRLTEIVHHFGADTAVVTIDAAAVNRFRDALMDDGAGSPEERKVRRRRKDKLTPASVNRYLATLRAALNLAEKSNWATAKPFDAVKLLREENKRERLPTEPELAAILGAATGELRLLVLLCRWTACRAGEVLSLEWRRVDLGSGFIRLEQKHTKARKSRSVPLPMPAIDALKAWRESGSASGPLFTRKISTMSPAFAKLCRQLGIENLHLHDLRHYRVTELLHSGAPVHSVKAIAGHSNIMMTDRYAHANEADMRRVVDAAEKTE